MLQANRDAALNAYVSAVKIQKETNNYGGEVFAHKQIAYLHQEAGQIPEAVDELLQARDLLYRTNGPPELVAEVEDWILQLKNPSPRNTFSPYDYLDWNPQAANY